MAMCSFVPPFHEVKFCGVPSCVFGKLLCAAGEKKVAEHRPILSQMNPVHIPKPCFPKSILILSTHLYMDPFLLFQITICL
jgi:hypothetical protein